MVDKAAPSCDYCLESDIGLREEGMGVFMCGVCRGNIDHATRTGLLNFWQLIAFSVLGSVGASSGAPVAAPLCLSPFAKIRPRRGLRWWRDSFAREEEDG